MSTDMANTGTGRIDEQALVTKANRQDLRFAILGFVVLVIAMITLMALVFDFHDRWRSADQLATS